MSEPGIPCRIHLTLVASLALCGCQDRAEQSATEPTDGQSAEAVSTPPPGPDLASCKLSPPTEDTGRMRTVALGVPDRMRHFWASDMDRFAILTQSGKTLCIDTRWIDGTENVNLTANDRFLSFDWTGNEAYGHMIVDRSGDGQVIDTGVPPVPSPSGRRLAALDYSESGFGALNALGVWELRPTEIAELARIEELPELTEWRIERWVGQICLELSAVAFDDMPDDYGQVDAAPRSNFIAREQAGEWIVQPSPPGACPTA